MSVQIETKVITEWWEKARQGTLFLNFFGFPVFSMKAMSVGKMKIVVLKVCTCLYTTDHWATIDGGSR